MNQAPPCSTTSTPKATDSSFGGIKPRTPPNTHPRPPRPRSCSGGGKAKKTHPEQNPVRTTFDRRRAGKSNGGSSHLTGSAEKRRSKPRRGQRPPRSGTNEVGTGFPPACLWGAADSAEREHARPAAAEAPRSSLAGGHARPVAAELIGGGTRAPHRP